MQPVKTLLLFLFLAALLAGCGDGVSANEEGGAQPSPTTMTDERDGQVYRIVTIGEQVWMAENLRYEYKVDGATYGNGCFVSEAYEESDESGDCAEYGRFYTWAAAVDSASVRCGLGRFCRNEPGFDDLQGVCPNGWRLPHNGDWLHLLRFLGGEDVAGTPLKASSGWGGNKNGTDAYGFAALPAGRRGADGQWSSVGESAYFWYSDDVSEEYAACMKLGSGAKAFKSYLNKGEGLAVRCVKDAD